jgi:hypothetical protein
MKQLVLLASLLVAVFAGPARAQVPTDVDKMTNVVAQAKAELKAAGVQVENKACTDFEIAKVVAGRVPGAGLLLKACCGDENDNNRSHCLYNGEWYAHDFVAFADGSGADMAIASGESNGPSWQINPPNPDYVGKYRSAATLGLTGLVAGSGPVHTPDPVPVPSPGVDLKPLLNDIAALKVQVTQLRMANDDLNRQLADAQSRIDNAESHAVSAINVADAVRDYLKAHPIPDGCRVSYLGCKPTFNYPPVQ